MNFRSAKVLDLKGNQVELDFQQIPSVSKLEFLRLSGTGLRSIEGVSRATGLKALHATNNEIRIIPEEVFHMVNLESLFLSFNSITGTISRKIGTLTSLKEFYLFGNHLTGTIPTDIGLLTSLTDFVVAQNFLSGELPDEISSLPSLEQLSVYDQDGLELITGPVPSFSGAPNLWYAHACQST
jgi:Leucine-rich repeat (LRR) protein